MNQELKEPIHEDAIEVKAGSNDVNDIDLDLLIKFDQEFSNLGVDFFFRNYGKLMYEGCRMMFTQVSTFFLSIVGFYLLNKQNDSKGQAILGMSSSFNTLAF